MWFSFGLHTITFGIVISRSYGMLGYADDQVSYSEVAGTPSAFVAATVAGEPEKAASGLEAAAQNPEHRRHLKDFHYLFVSLCYNISELAARRREQLQDESEDHTPQSADSISEHDLGRYQDLEFRIH
ncbi:hypothetical protein ACJJTC_019510 [Scirpophaga incertulas]